MPKNLLYVPTNRNCTGLISQLAEEAKLIGNCTIAIIEHGDASWSESHREALQEQGSQYGIDVIHMTRAHADDFLQKIVDSTGLSDEVSRQLLALLNPCGVSYGAGPNKAALIAAALRCSAMYRRDSDVLIDQWSTGPAHPCISESIALKQPLASLGLQKSGKTAGNYQNIHFVGTSSFGNAPHDRRDLLSVDEHFVTRIELLASPDESPEKLRDDNRQYLLVDPEIRYEEDFFELDETGRTVMLCCAMHEIFLELPEMPVLSTLGTDYMRRNTLRYLGSPIVYHSRKVKHSYEPDRAKQVDIKAIVDYAERDLRHMLFWPILTRHHAFLQQQPELFINADGQLDSQAYCRYFLQALEHSRGIMSDMPEKFAAIYREASLQAKDPLCAKRLTAVAEGIEQGPDYVAEVVKGVKDYVLLMTHWATLVNAAKCNSDALMQAKLALEPSKAV